MREFLFQRLILTVIVGVPGTLLAEDYRYVGPQPTPKPKITTVQQRYESLNPKPKKLGVFSTMDVETPLPGYEHLGKKKLAGKPRLNKSLPPLPKRTRRLPASVPVTPDETSVGTSR